MLTAQCVCILACLDRFQTHPVQASRDIKVTGVEVTKIERIGSIRFHLTRPSVSSPFAAEHSHIRGLGLAEDLTPKPVADGLVGQLKYSQCLSCID